MKSIGVIVVAVVALINFSGVRCNPIETEYEPKCDSYPVLNNEGLACQRIYKPLCGTDGFTYPNVCELCNTRLRTKTGIKIQHQEKCTIQEQCQRFEENMFCTMEYRPLCGSDNKIYSNMCAFCNGWKGNKALELISEGPCN